MYRRLGAHLLVHNKSTKLTAKFALVLVLVLSLLFLFFILFDFSYCMFLFYLHYV